MTGFKSSMNTSKEDTLKSGTHVYTGIFCICVYIRILNLSEATA